MSSADSHSRIVVGVDGSEAALTAVRYAAAEAVRTGSDLVVAHAGPGSLHLGAGPLGLYPLTPAEYRGIGTKMVNHARKAARDITGGNGEIRTALIEGESPSAALAAHALGAGLLVIGGRQRSLADRLLIGSVVNGVAGHAQVPVVVVPESWRPGDAKAVVAVGVEEVEGSERLIRQAMAIAADRGATLRIVHAWELPRLYDDLVVLHLDADRWRERKLQEIQKVLDRVSPQFPHVGIDVSIVHYQPAKALEAASKRADLLVLGRHRHGLRHLGGTARAVLQEAHCPVEVLPSVDVHAESHARVLDPALVG